MTRLVSPTSVMESLLLSLNSVGKVLTFSLWFSFPVCKMENALVYPQTYKMETKYI